MLPLKDYNFIIDYYNADEREHFTAKKERFLQYLDIEGDLREI
ncbi:hypothetical protein BleG1_0495 [Shouchella lehensis G1]|uniref:Uncharacterized protein n=1 Tax=Shouchella lehensis G1 TaxID=1246626 RepID=A0A060LXV0_9BACI|nr:hypothetical protein BleG1_0495 [Shouchella lehensis G1]